MTAAKKAPARKTAPKPKTPDKTPEDLAVEALINEPEEAEKPEPLTVEEIRERRKAAKESGAMDIPPAVDGDGEPIIREGAVPPGGFDLSDVDPEDPYAGLSREELVEALERAKGNARVQAPDRRATLMYAPRGNCRFYLNGKANASWDKTEPEAHIWRQIEVKCRATLEHEVDVVHWPHKILPDMLPPEGDLGVRATPKITDVVKPQPAKPGVGAPTTSYQTASGVQTESI